MAKLSARGRTELVRLMREWNLEETPDRSTIWEKSTITLMSDNTVLEKRDVRFRPDVYAPNGRLYSYGWKRLGKVKEGLTREQFIDIYTRKGYSVGK